MGYAQSAALSFDYARSAPFFVVRFDSARFRFHFIWFFTKCRFTIADAKSPSPASLSMLSFIPVFSVWCPFDTPRPTIASQRQQSPPRASVAFWTY